MYIGLRHKRVRGQRYDDLIDEFLTAVVRRLVKSHSNQTAASSSMLA